jgi:hypothetical protein
MEIIPMFFSSKRPRAKRPQELAQRNRFRPQLEQLEQRALLSTLTVTNLSDSGPGSLRDAINMANASPDSTIDFAPGLTGTIKLRSTLPLISVSMEIDGPGASDLTVSGQNITGVFQVIESSSTGVATINDLTIANGRGGMYDDQGILNLSRVTFANNQSGSVGGALDTLFAQVTVTDCVFNANRVIAPSGSSFEAGGGAIFSVFAYPLTVIGTKFTNNTVVGANFATPAAGFQDVGLAEGGAVVAFGDTTGDIFTGCTFSGNSARGGRLDSGGSGTYTIGVGRGGAIQAEGGSVVEVDLCKFSSNVAQGGIGLDGAGGGFVGTGRGGAINLDSSSQVTVNDSTFSNNHALGANFGTANSGTSSNEGEGGAIHAEGSGTNLIIAGSGFTGNTAVGGISGYLTGTGGYIGSAGLGGAIRVGPGASADISGSTFTANVALGGRGYFDGTGGDGRGGAVRASGAFVTISDSQFSRNRATGGMGGASGGSGGLGYGGGLAGDAGTVSLMDLTFTSNQAVGGIGQGSGAKGGDALGGAMEFFSAIVNADTITVKSNIAQGGAGLNGANGGTGEGGGINARDNVSCTISNSLVTLNEALAGIASGGGSNGAGYGGGIWHFGVLDLPDTLVMVNFATTSNPDIF